MAVTHNTQAAEHGKNTKNRSAFEEEKVNHKTVRSDLTNIPQINYDFLINPNLCYYIAIFGKFYVHSI